jgi:hypothetical protein
MLKARKGTMLWGEKSEVVLICYRYNSIDVEVRAASSRGQPKKHFSAQLDIEMYGFIYKNRAQRAERKTSRSSFGALRLSI